MKKKNKHVVAAFTLSELLVVLVISSIVISIGFLALGMIQKQIRQIRNALQQQQEVQFLERLLWQDFNTYTVQYNAKEDLYYLTNSTDSLTYRIQHEKLIRKNDTLPVQILNKRLFLDGQETVTGSVDAMEVQTSHKKLFIYSHKDAAYYMNR